MTEENPAARARYGMESLAGTGDARVDEAVGRLDELADAPLEEHPVILGQIHDQLREVLGELSPGAPATPRTSGPPGAPVPGTP